VYHHRNTVNGLISRLTQKLLLRLYLVKLLIQLLYIPLSIRIAQLKHQPFIFCATAALPIRFCRLRQQVRSGK